jgi:histidine ammonia-lyase
MKQIFDHSISLNAQEILTLLRSNEIIPLEHIPLAKLNHSRSFLEGKTALGNSAVYGVNTGFGSLCNTVVQNDRLSELQLNLLRSHACGTGAEVPQELVRLMLLLKIRGLSFGYSGVSVSTFTQLVQLYNHGIIPVVYEQGSLGASGDLAPLAHMSLPLVGEGEVYYEGKKMTSLKALQLCGLKPIELQSKEGLALINGTQFMLAYASWLCVELNHLIEKSLLIAGMSLDAYHGRQEPFHATIHAIRPHNGQIHVAQKMTEILRGSEILALPKEHVQDPYSFRCIPQVLGAAIDTLQHANQVVMVEINSVTDNPLVFAEENLILSGGNFHGQPLAMALDFLCIAAAEVGSISERRTYKLISGSRNLPPYLANDPGLQSGYMIPQYTAASIVSQNKHLANPACTDTIDSSNGQEDHVSMGANAATKCYRVMENLRQILAIELLTAARALEFRRPKKSSALVEDLYARYRKIVPRHEGDIIFSEPMRMSSEFLKIK